MLYSMQDELLVARPLAEVWSFFSDPGNLERITPQDLGFRITSAASSEIYPGQIITYTVTPLLGVPLEWVTEITHVVPEKLFVDEQRFGPYAFWHHLHRFTARGDCTLVQDCVHYRLPFGLLGRVVHPLLVRPKLERIFSFRRQAVGEILSGPH
jgi:ligand-binding SRPBCC domain-containing protein